MATSNWERDQELSRYIERVRSIPALSREDEHALAVRSTAGDPNARQALIEANLRFVVAVALQYRRYGLPLGDLIAEGNLGLTIASRKFDAERGTRFVTYAGYWIRALVLDLVVRASSMVGAGSGPLRSKVFFRLRRERAKLATLDGDESSRLATLATSFETTPEKMGEMLQRLDARDLSLDTPVFSDSSTTMLDSLESAGSDPEGAFGQAEQDHAVHAAIADALGGLDRRERFIVEQRFLGDAEVSLAEIGRHLGVSRERARQLEARAKSKLRSQLEGLELDRVA